ncbi:hypothetical protein MJO29_009364 [Puccinia striiformis f. sp. tritici]|nr:hypothetical protein MJO29_009364 [Puccinia striiformis f. sp. tritici]
MSGPVSKHPPPRINPSTEMSRLSLTSSSLRKPKLDGNLCREAEHRISIQDLSSTSQHGPSQGTGLARPEVIGQYTIAPEIPMSGPVSKHPPPRINPSTEMSGLSLPSSSSNKPKFDEKLSREAEHRISIPSSAFKHEPSRNIGSQSLVALSNMSQAEILVWQDPNSTQEYHNLHLHLLIEVVACKLYHRGVCKLNHRGKEFVWEYFANFPVKQKLPL